MIEVVRWFSLSLSLFALCCSLYSLYLSMSQNRRLIHRNHELLMENAMLRALCTKYEDDLARLRKEESDEGDNNNHG